MKLFTSKDCTGRVTFESGRQYGCRFSVCLYENGTIMAWLDITDSTPVSFSLDDEIRKIEGESDHGHLESLGRVRTVRAIYGKYASSYQRNDFVLAMERIKIRSGRSYRDYRQALFVCNLAFPFFTDSFVGRLQIGNVSFTIRSKADYEATAFELDAFNTTKLTATVVTNGKRAEIVENFLLSLSIITGTYVNFVARKIIGKETIVLLENRITRPFSGLSLLDVKNVIELNIILNHILDSAGRFRGKYISKYLILSYLDIKNENNYLESKGIRLAAWFEQLKEDIVKTEPKYKKKNFKKKMILSVAKLRCRNDVPYSKVVLLVKCRNSLIHEGDFFSRTATTKDRQKYDLTNRADEYLFLLQIAHIFLLRGLNYLGQVKDYRKIFQCGGDFA